LARIDRTERNFKLAFIGAAIVESLFLVTFLYWQTSQIEFMCWLLISTVSCYTIVVLGLVALGAQRQSRHRACFESRRIITREKLSAAERTVGAALRGRPYSTFRRSNYALRTNRVEAVFCADQQTLADQSGRCLSKSSNCIHVR
jgi:hypothetical protein